MSAKHNQHEQRTVHRAQLLKHISRLWQGNVASTHEVLSSPSRS